MNFYVNFKMQDLPQDKPTPSSIYQNAVQLISLVNMTRLKPQTANKDGRNLHYINNRFLESSFEAQSEQLHRCQLASG